MRATAAVLVAIGLVASACGANNSNSGEQKTIIVAVDAPFSQSPYIGNTIANGARLAADQLAATGSAYKIRVIKLDNALSPSRAVAGTRRALREHATAIVTDGTGIDATWQLANKQHVPICITYQGGVGLVNPATRPNVFRIAPTDHGLAFRLAEYLVPKGLKIALLTDDSDYGQEGRTALADAFATVGKSVAARITLPSSAGDLAPQVLQARRPGATALLVWAQPAVLAKTIVGARSAGWHVPIYTTPAGEDPFVRQQLADHPRWVDGLTLASGRMTAELGSAPWSAFEAAYETAFGATYVGVKSHGQRVIAPPDYAMYSYDFVNLLAAAVQRAHGTDGSKVVAALNEVSTHGANGDERGFNERNHEGVVDDDVYFAQFRDMVFRPVRDDPLSSTLPVIRQVR
jgi:ABC-type branched-subunit amino acid transport system substrate-binding protein